MMEVRVEVEVELIFLQKICHKVTKQNPNYQED